MSKRHVIGVDVGGTYTDIFIIDEETGECSVGKVPSQRGTEAYGILDALTSSGVPLDRISTIVHGTTVGTNSLLERKGSRVALVTTKGFRDVLEMRRRDRPQTWGLWGVFDPVVPRNMRFEIDERTLADGAVLRRPDPAEVSALVHQMKSQGAEAVAVCLINAYANPENERMLVEAIRAFWDTPDFVTASTEILPEAREFERSSTIALNAYLQPVVGRYLEALRNSLKDEGFDGQILIVQSNGGVMDLDLARLRPVRTALSGPAAGVIAAAQIARQAGIDNAITGDVGGTSFDVSLIASGETAQAPQTSISFGMVIRSPMIEMQTIGAGGGSIARLDRSGLLQVGPESAGSVPGPACFAAGNTQPTVTDANVVLGLINADRPIGATSKTLDLQAARNAVANHVGGPLGLSIEDAAEAILSVANSRMAGALRLVSIERGHDPRKFTLLPFGGGGALHAGDLIRSVGLAQALIPRYPGVTSALGCVIADMRHDFVQTLNVTLEKADIDGLNRQIVAFHRQGEALLDASGVRFVGRATVVTLDMSYVGQTHTFSVPVHWSETVPLDAATIEACFLEHYRAQFGSTLDRVPLRLFNVNVARIGEREKFDLRVIGPAPGASIETARAGTRQVYFNGGWIDAEVYRRLELPASAEIAGPAILEQPDTTIWVSPDMRCTVDEFGNILLTRSQGEPANARTGREVA